MPDFFDSIESFFRSLFHESDAYTTDSSGRKRYFDPDMQDAWDELEEYLNEGKNKPKNSTSYSKKSSTQSDYRQQRLKALQQTLKEDYANLKVRFAAPFEEVKKAHKKLLRQYHPDRYANNPERFKMATEITQKINQSFQKIKAFEQKKLQP
jgi:deoxyribodipyrimidine photolyase